MLTASCLPPLMGHAQQLVVLFHGRGSNAQDLIPIAHAWQEALPSSTFLCLSAPQPCPDVPAFCRQWFDLEDWDPPALLSTQTHFLPSMRKTALQIDKFLDKTLEEHGLSDSQLALMGFSQGSMMALYMGLSRKNPCAGVLGYGGALLCEAQDVRSKPPVFLFHGQADDVVSPKEVELAKTRLTSWDVPTQTHLRPRLGHGIDETGLAQGAAFLKKIFTPHKRNVA